MKRTLLTSSPRCGPRKLSHILLTCLTRANKEFAQRQSLSRATTAQALPQHNSPTSLLAPSAHPNLPHRSVSDTFATEHDAATAHQETIVPLSTCPVPIPVPITPLPSPPTLIVPRLTPSHERQGEYFTPTILLVDDNAINLKLLVVFAKRQNLRYEEATNGLEALTKYKSEAMATDPPARPFDFVLMDLSMPVMGGLESTRQIRQFEKKMGLGRCCIVALTGLASAQDQLDAADAGVDMYLVKPVKFADIKRVFGAK